MLKRDIRLLLSEAGIGGEWNIFIPQWCKFVVVIKILSMTSGKNQIAFEELSDVRVLSVRDFRIAYQRNRETGRISLAQFSRSRASHTLLLSDVNKVYLPFPAPPQSCKSYGYRCLMSDYSEPFVRYRNVLSGCLNPCQRFFAAEPSTTPKNPLRRLRGHTSSGKETA